MRAPADPTTLGITSRLVGGLGNQLFQYAAGRGLATRLGCPLFLDQSPLAQVGASDTVREFALDWLIEPSQLIDSGKSQTGRLVSAVRRRVPSFAGGRVFQQQGFAYDPRITQVSLGAILSGYFQSWRYFADIDQELRQDLLAHIPQSAWQAHTAAQLQSLGPWIALHVRRGDYLLARNSAFHGLLGRAYYERALALLKSKGVSGQIVLFSDDPQSAKTMLGDLASHAVLIEPSAGAHAMESIGLIAQAPAIITANSSFSWWGGWLADPQNSMVVSPNQWLNEGAMDEQDLRPPQWLTVDAGFGQA